jgi:uncharacterized protein (DUF1015 family)
MADIRGLRPLQYSLDRFGSTALSDRIRLTDELPVATGGRVADLTDLACPPYDIISPALQRELAARNPRNAVRVELGEAANQHRSAARLLGEWIEDGSLVRPGAEQLYGYRHTASRDAAEFAVRGVLARVRLEPWGASVHPHERTMPGPKADRLSLLRSTHTQLSPILMVYFDPKAVPLPEPPAGADEWRARDDDGLIHALTALGTDDRLLGALSRQGLFVADGHHRYETALAYQQEIRSDPRRTDAPAGSLAADWIMVVLVNAAREPMEVRPTHRLLVGVDPDRLRAAVTAPNPLFSALPFPPAELGARLGELRGTEEPVFGVVLPGGEGWLLVGDVAAVGDRMRREPVSPAVAGLDLAILHAVVLGDWLGIGEAEVAAGETLLYTRSEAEALARVSRGEASAALLVRPTELSELAAVARGGELMPQKSTYFYPKLLTGLAFHPLAED